jgi:hypothetical protein
LSNNKRRTEYHSCHATAYIPALKDGALRYNR